MVEYDEATKKLLAQKGKKTKAASGATKPRSENGKSAPKTEGKAAGQRARRTPLPAALMALVDNYVTEHTTEFSRINKGAVVEKVRVALTAQISAAVDEFIASNAAGILG